MDAITPWMPRPLPAKAVGILGRAAELTRIRTLLPDRRFGGVAVSGPGCSRVLTEAAERAAGQGFQVEFAAGGRRLSAVAAAAVLDPAARLLVVADDAHLLDPADSELLRQLVRRGLVRVLAGGPPGLWPGERLGRVELPPLPAAESLTLARALTGDHPAAARLTGLAAGSPRLLRELVLLAADRGMCHGDSLAEVVELRLAALPRSQRQALDVVAEAGCVALPVFQELVAEEDLIALAERELLVAVETDQGWRVELAHQGLATALGAKPPVDESSEDGPVDALALLRNGRIEEALSAAREWFEGAAAPDRSRRALTLAVLLLARGQIQRARDLLDVLPLADPRWVLLRATSTAQLGEPVDAELPGWVPEHLATGAALARAWVAASHGDLVEAEAALRTGGAAQPWDRALRAHTLGRLGLAAVAEPIWDSTGQLGYVKARLDYSRAIATGDAELLAAVAEEFLGAGALLHGAEALAELGVLHRRAGRLREAAAAVRRARSLPVRGTGARTPALVRLAEQEPLSARENEVVRLAAAGLTDPQIALRLGVSVRTVNNHIHRAYRKLGCTGRADLPVSAPPPPAAPDSSPAPPPGAPGTSAAAPW